MVIHIDPSDARVLGAVRVPTSAVTSCTFGGPDRRTLYITSARAGLSSEALAAEPEAGGVFAFRPDDSGVDAPSRDAGDEEHDDGA